MSEPVAAPLPADDPYAQIFGACAAHARLIDQLRRIAASDAPALIEGETGSGKELAARAIHYGGARRGGPFVPVNCGALPDTLVEAELFGHARGAFTDAHAARSGLVAEAAGGTLFLDEIDALSPKAQVTLLRFLQDQCYRPVGTPRERRSDLRLLAASNRPLQALMHAREFRADLMYRLNILHVVLPPLRERAGDAALLAQRFVEMFAAKYRQPPKTLHPDTLRWLDAQPWPGNVRELENWVHRRFLMCSGTCIAHADGAPDAPAGAAPGSTQGPRPGAPASFQRAKAEALRAFECDYLAHVLALTQGNVTRAAHLAGKERRAFGKLLKKHGLAARAQAAEAGAPPGRA